MAIGKWMYIAGLLGTAIFWGILWLNHPANDQVEELEDQLSMQYLYASYILRTTVEELLEWDFSQPLTDEKLDDFRNISYEFRNIRDLFFSGYTVHQDWEDRLFDAERYLRSYEQALLLSEEDAANLQQILQATRFISRDFTHHTGQGDFYDAMKSDKHEMVERVKSRLTGEY